MTALENVHGRPVLPDLGRGRSPRSSAGRSSARGGGRDPGTAQELLDFVGLGKSAEHLARNLPYGDQRRLEIARALATDPQLLLLDEPTAGMNPQETRRRWTWSSRSATGASPWW